jgi:hypothetical protein
MNLTADQLARRRCPRSGRRSGGPGRGFPTGQTHSYSVNQKADRFANCKCATKQDEKSPHLSTEGHTHFDSAETG